MLKKMVNGIEVVCSAEEEAEIRAEWAANEVAKLTRPAPKSAGMMLLDQIKADPGALAALKAELAK